MKEIPAERARAVIARLSDRDLPATAIERRFRRRERDREQSITKWRRHPATIATIRIDAVSFPDGIAAEPRIEPRRRQEGPIDE
jgi:hypothetical protein